MKLRDELEINDRFKHQAFAIIYGIALCMTCITLLKKQIEEQNNCQIITNSQTRRRLDAIEAYLATGPDAGKFDPGLGTGFIRYEAGATLGPKGPEDEKCGVEQLQTVVTGNERLGRSVNARKSV